MQVKASAIMGRPWFAYSKELLHKLLQLISEHEKFLLYDSQDILPGRLVWPTLHEYIFWFLCDFYSRILFPQWG